MKKIPLTQGKYALVDDADHRRLNQFKWCVYRGGGTFYATRQSPMILMHREILGLKYHDGKYADHIDGNGLNNQRVNLRECTRQQNNHNSQSYLNASSKFKGVYRRKDGRKSRKWRAAITCNRIKTDIGTFSNEIQAAKAYDEKAKELFGEFARLNFP